MARIMILAVIGVFGASAAWADIGTVGNPHLPKSVEPKTEAAPAASAQLDAQKPEAKPEADKSEAKPPEEQKPLVEITFDRNFVNYAGALEQGVAAAEKAKLGVIYTVVSYLPAASPSALQNQRMGERAETDLRTVVGALNQRGIPTTRIHVMTKPGTENYDVVKVFVE